MPDGTPGSARSGRDILAGLRALIHTLIFRAASLVLDRPFWKVALVLVLARFLKAPVQAWTLLDHELLISHSLPRLPPFAYDDWFLLTSPEGPILARLLGIVSETAFIELHVAIIGLGLVALIWATHRARGERAARLVLLMLITADVAIFLGNTVGGYDPFTFIASSFLVLASSAPAVLASSIALGLFHFEQGVFIAIALLIIGPKRSLGRRMNVLLVFSGLVIGKLVLTAFLAAIGAPLYPRVTYAIDQMVVTVSMAFHFLPAMVYAALGPAWVWLATLMLKVGREWGQVRRGFFALAFLAAPMILTLDETRVYALISWPVLMTLMLVAERRAPEKDLRFLVGMTTLAMVILPSGWVWLGRVGFPDFATTKGVEIAALRVFLLGLLLLLPPVASAPHRSTGA